MAHYPVAAMAIEGNRERLAAALVVGVLVFDGQRAAAQVELYRFVGGAESTGPAGDNDNDGVPDIAYGAVLGAGANRDLVIRSGRDGAELRRFAGVYPPVWFDVPLTVFDDFDADGTPDLLVTIPTPSPPTSSARVRVLSGSTGATLLDLTGTQAFPQSLFGAALAVLGDVDADGRRDFAIGDPSWDSAVAGRVVVCSGATGQALWQRSNAGLEPMFATALAVCDDVDQDGAADLAVGDPSALAALGSVTVYSARTGQLLWSATGTVAFGDFGRALCAVRDLDGDGFDEVVVGAPALTQYLNGALVIDDRVVVLSGADGHVLRTLHGASGPLPVLLGMEVVSPGDVDGDGAADITVRTQFNETYVIAGSARTYSGLTGAWIGLQQLEYLPWQRRNGLVLVGDLNGDGVSDLATTRPKAVHLMTITEAPYSYCTAKVNSLGCVPAISSSGAASLAVGDNFVVSASNVLNHKPGVLLWGANALSAPFGGGTLCVGPNPPVIRGPLLGSGGSPAGVNDCSGSYAFHFSHALLQAHGLTAGSELFAQFASRDPGFPRPRNVGLSDALRFVVLP